MVGVQISGGLPLGIVQIYVTAMNSWKWRRTKKTTPPKPTMSPENWWFWRLFSFGNGSFSGDMLLFRLFRGCNIHKRSLEYFEIFTRPSGLTKKHPLHLHSLNNLQFAPTKAGFQVRNLLSHVAIIFRGELFETSIFRGELLVSGWVYHYISLKSRCSVYHFLPNRSKHPHHQGVLVNKGVQLLIPISRMLRDHHLCVSESVQKRFAGAGLLDLRPEVVSTRI